MPRPRPTTWSTPHRALIAERPAPVRLGSVLAYGVILLIVVALSALIIDYSLPTVLEEGWSGQVSGRYGLVAAWLPLSVGVLMATVFGVSAIVMILSPRPRIVLLRLTPDSVFVLTDAQEFPTEAPWSDVVDVRVESMEGAVRLVVAVAGQAEALVMRDLVEPYPATAVVFHFWRNPGDRAQLGRAAGGRTADRVLAALSRSAPHPP